VTAPVLVTEMPAGVVWLPTNAAGLPVRRELAGAPGSVVRVAVAAGEIEREATA
jgi:NADH-quinone oxidoreductase subunit G